MKAIKLFGFYLPAIQDDHQDSITTNDEASRKRKFIPYQEEDDDHSFIPKKPKLCDDGEGGEDAVPPSEFHPLSVTTGEDDGYDEDAVKPISAFFPEEGNDSFIPKKSKLLKLSGDGKEGEETVHPLSSVTTDDAILGKRKLSSCNQEEDDDDDSFIPKKPKLLRLIDDGMSASGSPNQKKQFHQECWPKEAQFKKKSTVIYLFPQNLECSSYLESTSPLMIKRVTLLYKTLIKMIKRRRWRIKLLYKTLIKMRRWRKKLPIQYQREMI